MNILLLFFVVAHSKLLILTSTNSQLQICQFINNQCIYPTNITLIDNNNIFGAPYFFMNQNNFVLTVTNLKNHRPYDTIIAYDKYYKIIYTVSNRLITNAAIDGENIYAMVYNFETENTELRILNQNKTVFIFSDCYFNKEFDFYAGIYYAAMTCYNDECYNDESYNYGIYILNINNGSSKKIHSKNQVVAIKYNAMNQLLYVIEFDDDVGKLVLYSLSDIGKKINLLYIETDWYIVGCGWNNYTELYCSMCTWLCPKPITIMRYNISTGIANYESYPNHIFGFS